MSSLSCCGNSAAESIGNTARADSLDARSTPFLLDGDPPPSAGLMSEVPLESTSSAGFQLLVLQSLQKHTELLRGLEESHKSIELNLTKVQASIQQAIPQSGTVRISGKAPQAVRVDDSVAFGINPATIAPVVVDQEVAPALAPIASLTSQKAEPDSPLARQGVSARSNVTPPVQLTQTTTTHDVAKGKKGIFGVKKSWTCHYCDEMNKLDLTSCAFCGGHRPRPTRVQKIVQHPLFDAACGVVIICNAVTIAIASHHNLTWAMQNPGSNQAPTKLWEAAFSWFFLIFYLMELILRLFVQGHKFFTGEDWHWNSFDFILVLLVLYENIIAAFVTSIVTVNVSWLRIIRLLKMMKIFRVVRLMRFFRMLRLMVSQITGSFMMLLWASLLLFMMIFLFSLCFVHGVTEFLLATPRVEISNTAWKGINDYWSSLGHAMISLYMALAGGTDWYNIAAPLKVASGFYYGIFLFYIGFSFISVVNVVTSLYVDSALKISDQDESTVQEAQAEREEVTKLMQLYKSKDEDGTGLVSWINFKASLKSQEMTYFMDSLGITLVDVKRVFKLLQRNGNVDIEEFIVACMKAVGDTRNLDLVQIHGDTKRNTSQIGDLFEYFEDRFKTLMAVCGQPVGAQGIELDASQSDRLRQDFRELAANTATSSRMSITDVVQSKGLGQFRSVAAHKRAYRVTRGL